MKRIELLWVAYKAAGVPKNASEVQVTETRRAFYAGAASLFSAIIGLMEPGDEHTDEDLAKMDEINGELLAFLQQVERGEY